MDEHPTTALPQPPRLDLPGASWPDWRWLALLLVLVAGIRAWQLSHTEVTSRDSIAYIRYAWRLESEPFSQVLRDSEHHPGYPLAIYLASKLVRPWLPHDRPFAMQLAAQLVSCLASVLLVFPMFYLGRELFDRRVGFWAALLFQLLPGPGRMLVDGLSDPLALLFAATALWLALVALRTNRPIWFVLVGLSSGLAYLTRTEGALIALVTGFVLLAQQAGTRWQRPWRQFLRCGAALTAAAALLAVPFMLLIGGVSLKPSATHMLHASIPLAATHPGQQPIAAPLPLAMWWIGPDVHPEDRYGWAARAVLVELDKGFFHLLGLPALLGVVLFRRRFVEVPGGAVLAAAGILLLLLLYRLGQSNGYVGERHVLLLLLGGLYFAIAALAFLGALLGRILARWRPSLTPCTVNLTLLVLLAIAPLAHTLGRLHDGREGFRQAGLWLAAHARPEDRIIDPFAWATYHAGRIFQSHLPGEDAKVCYVVLEEGTNKHPHLRYLIDPAEELVHTHPHERAQTFNVGRGRNRAEVVVWRVRM
jgi:hypothetical protein